MNKRKFLREIETEMRLNSTLHCNLTFGVYSDSQFVYYLKEDDLQTEIKVIADDDFFSEEDFETLSRKKRMQYFEHTVYFKNNGEWERVGNKYYGDNQVNK